MVDTSLLSSLLALFASLLVILTGGLVWSGDKHDQKRTDFLWLSIFVSLWIFSNIFFPIADPFYRFPIALFSYGVAMLVMTQALRFCATLGNIKIPSAFFAVGFCAALVSIIPGVIAHGIHGTTILTNSVSLLIYGILLVVFAGGSVLTLLRTTKGASYALRQKISVILTGLIGSALIGLTCNLGLPLLGNYSFTQIGPAASVLFIVAIGYSIIKYRLFDVRLVVVRTVTYLAVLTTLGILYYTAAFLASSLLLQTPAAPQQEVINICLAILLVFIFQPIKGFFDRITNELFYQGGYNSDTFFEEFNKELSITNDLHNLLLRTANKIERTFKSEQVFYTVCGKEGHIITAGTKNHSQLPSSDVRFLDTQEIIIRNDVIALDDVESKDELRRLFISHRITLVLPLRRKGNIIGYAFLGEQKARGYTRRDLRVLTTISDELVIAIENALSVQEVKEFNETLQRRVQEATQELRITNAQLHKLDETKDEFISMASHQLRTPLTSIKGYLSMVIEGDAGKITESQRHFLTEAFTSSERMVHLINDFLNVSRLQTGKFVIDKRPIDLSRIVEEEIETLKSNAASRNLKFSYRSPKKFPIADIDEGKIRQVIMNFADNAIYYSHENTTIKIELSFDDRYAIFIVRDTGIGVPENEQVHLFTKFYRASNARKQRPDGTGVGLFLAKKVIVAHGGNVIFESVEGKGSSFGFRLPLTKS